MHARAHFQNTGRTLVPGHRLTFAGLGCGSSAWGGIGAPQTWPGGSLLPTAHPNNHPLTPSPGVREKAKDPRAGTLGLGGGTNLPNDMTIQSIDPVIIALLACAACFLAVFVALILLYIRMGRIERGAALFEELDRECQIEDCRARMASRAEIGSDDEPRFVG